MCSLGSSATDPKTLLHPKWQECSFGPSWVCNNKSIYDRTLDRFRVDAWRAIHLNIKSEISTHDLNLKGLDVGKELINSLESSELANHISMIRSINIWVMDLALGWWIHWCAKKVPNLKRAWNDTSTPNCVLSSTWLFLNSMLYNSSIYNTFWVLWNILVNCWIWIWGRYYNNVWFW